MEHAGLAADPKPRPHGLPRVDLKQPILWGATCTIGPEVTIRGPVDPSQDQKRTLSLPEAIACGADYVVVGRPISEASDPRAVVAAYEASLASHRSSERTQA